MWMHDGVNIHDIHLRSTDEEVLVVGSRRSRKEAAMRGMSKRNRRAQLIRYLSSAAVHRCPPSRYPDLDYPWLLLAYTLCPRIWLAGQGNGAGTNPYDQFDICL